MVSRTFYGIDPFQEMRRLQSEINRVAQNATATTVGGFPAINVFANQDGVVITAELPGVNSESLDVSVHRDTVTLKGERRDEAEDAIGYHRRERRQGGFARTFGLPFRVDPDKVEAEMKNGALKLILQRHEEDKPKRISVKSS
jgi:HSP20 family protein